MYWLPADGHLAVAVTSFQDLNKAKLCCHHKPSLITLAMQHLNLFQGQKELITNSNESLYDSFNEFHLNVPAEIASLRE